MVQDNRILICPTKFVSDAKNTSKPDQNILNDFKIRDSN